MISDVGSRVTGWFSGKRVWITGGAGFIGTSIVRQLSAIDCRITRVVRAPAPPLETSSKARVEDMIADVRGQNFWSRAPGELDVVFHLAGQTSTYEANRDPRADMENNVLPVLLMLQAFRDRTPHPAIICASTVTICGLPSKLPVNEDYPDCPITIYDLHKQMAENYLKYEVRDGGARGAALRLSNVYGPGPRSSRADRGILNQMVARALRGEALTLYGRGDQIRDYVHVDDVAGAFLAAAIHADALHGSHFVIGSGTGHSIAQALNLVAERVSARSGRVAHVASVEPPAGLSPIEARNFVADSALFSRMTGWRPRYDLATGIDTILDSLL